MKRVLILFPLALISLLTRADEPMIVKIGDTEIKIPIPAGMSELPKDDLTVKALADLTPANCALLRSCMQSDALDPTKTLDPSVGVLHSDVFMMKDVPQDIYSGDFIDFVARQSLQATRGILAAQSYFNEEDIQKGLDKFQKDTGVGMQADSDLYSLGMVSRSDACVSFMTAQYVMVTYQGKQQREKCLSVVGYVRLRKKVVIVVTTLVGPLILNGDILPLKHAAEKIQLQLQILNNE